MWRSRIFREIFLPQVQKVTRPDAKTRLNLYGKSPKRAAVCIRLASSCSGTKQCLAYVTGIHGHRHMCSSGFIPAEKMFHLVWLLPCRLAPAKARARPRYGIGSLAGVDGP